MKTRIDLDNNFRKILGSTNVYYNPPENLKMKYPCIRYKLNSIENIFANNVPYLGDKGYSGLVISKDPDCDIIDKVLELPKSNFNNFYIADGLCHWAFLIYS